MKDSIVFPKKLPYFAAQVFLSKGEDNLTNSFIKTKK